MLRIYLLNTSCNIYMFIIILPCRIYLLQLQLHTYNLLLTFIA